MKLFNHIRFELLLLTHSNHVGLATLFVYAWIANCDDDIDFQETDVIREIGELSQHSERDVHALLDIAKHRDISSLQLAVELIKDKLTYDDARLFIEAAISVSIADGILLPSEMYFLQFLGDLLDVSREELDHLFYEITGKELLEADDYSSAHFWKGQDSKHYRTYSILKQQKQNKQSWYRNNKTDSEHFQNSLTIETCYALLGLTNSASMDEVKNAYRTLALRNHPDRFVSIGKEAVAAATRRKDADTVLLNPLRKALYDRSNRSLTEISAVRANMGLSHASDWQNSMAPHYPHTKPPLASKLRNFKKRNKASNKIYIVLSHIIHGNIIIRYSAAALFIFLILKISYAIVS